MVDYFSRAEKTCNCGCGLNKVDDNPDFLESLNKAREIYGKPMIVTCMTRCKKHNKEVGGASKSAHLDGRAVDIKCVNSNDRAELHDALFATGFRRFEFSGVHVHADMKINAIPMILLKFPNGTTA